MIGLAREELSVDGCITKAPCGGEKAGRSPVDRGNHGLKRSVASEARCVPLGLVSADANRHDSSLAATLEAAKDQVGALPNEFNVNLDRGWDSAKTRAALEEFGFTGTIAHKGVPAPIQAGKRWVIERTHGWMNGFGKLRRCTEKTGTVMNLYLYLAGPSSRSACSSAVPPCSTAGTDTPPLDASSDDYHQTL
ncbi:Transposase DDE domain-containing protein [Actinacidiphila glaucinigra]|uniref:Transposase DDE domain-containing protein n=1 Tax=Actinacidiphila glaucinigra TaxID=235986 RepID=A0A239MP82_9ACTN|nr:Transposase DDE domain-containing protein [Actinacidiphila glaucinigra]